MQNIFEKNMKAWESLYPDTKEFIQKKYKEYQEEEKKEITVEQDYNCNNILVVNREGKRVYLGGKRNSLRIVEEWGKNFEKAQPGAFIFLVGMGNPNFLLELDQVMASGARILIYEPSMEIFFSVMENMDISIILSGKRSVVFLVDGINDEMIERSVATIIDVNMLPYFDLYICPNYNVLFLEKVTKFVKTVGRLCERERVGLNTNIRYLPVRSENVFHNILHVNNGHKTEQFTEFISRDIPAFIVGAGPSLDKNIEELKRAKGHGLIIACDTAVKPLLARGIVPDIYAIVDGLKPLHLVQAEGTDEIPMLTSVTATYTFLDQNKSTKIFYNENDPLVNRLFWQNGKDFPTMPCGGSVATSAFAFAYLIGVKNIVLVGQDLALSGKHVHAVGTFDSKEDEVKENGTFMVDGNYEEKVRTRDDFYAYLRWFEYYIEGCKEYEPDFRVINATEGGAKIKFTEIKTLKETIDELCTQEVDIQAAIEKVPFAFDDYQKGKNIEFLRSVPNQFKDISKKAEELQKLYKKIEKLAEVRNMDVKAYVKVLKKIEKSTKEIDRHYECMCHISETLKIADFIINSEAGMELSSINEEGMDISRKGIMYSKLLKECADLFAETTEEIYKDLEV